MALRITNRAKHLLIIPLNSGGTIHLAAGESSDAIEEYEIENNEKVKKLLDDHLITSTPVEATHGPSTAGESSQGTIGKSKRGPHTQPH